MESVLFRAWTKKIDALLANVLSKANRGGAAAAAASNAKVVTNASPVGPASTVLLATPGLTTSAEGSGKVRIWAGAQVGIGGGTSVAGELAQFNLIMDGSPITGAPTCVVEYSATHGAAQASLAWEVTTTPGTNHTYGIEVANQTTPSHTTTLQTNGGYVIAQEVVA